MSEPEPRYPDDALCAQVGYGDLWYPEKGGSTREAKAVCAACPVREACLEAALQRGERFGVFGGLSERERRAILVERGLPTRDCGHCGVGFDPATSGRNRYCGDDCAEAAHEEQKAAHEARKRGAA